MEEIKIHELISERRFNKYLTRCEGNKDNALQYYIANTRISESTYWSLHCFEIILRNKIHQKLTQVHETDKWYDVWLESDTYSDFHSKINETKEYLDSRREEITPNKMVAEFTLGFWIKLFNAEYEYTLWKPLRLIFNNMRKQDRKLKNIKSKLNKIRKFRNRIYHYEPICWNFNNTAKNYENINIILKWIDEEAYKMSSGNNDFFNHIQYFTKKLNNLGIKHIEVIK